MHPLFHGKRLRLAGKWTSVSPCLQDAPTALYGHSSCVYGSSVYVFGGYDSTEAATTVGQCRLTL